MGELSRGVAVSGGLWLLGFSCLSNLRVVKRRRTSFLKSHAKS